MKHDNSFLLIIFLLLAGCGQKDRAKSQFESSVQTEESYSLAKEYIKEAVITGKVLNRDFYPQEKELTLIIPFFWKMENQYPSNKNCKSKNFNRIKKEQRSSKMLIKKAGFPSILKTRMQIIISLI